MQQMRGRDAYLDGLLGKAMKRRPGAGGKKSRAARHAATTRSYPKNFCELDRIAAASDAELLACLDKDTVKLRLVREAGDAMAAKRKSQTQSHGPILEAYVA